MSCGVANGDVPIGHTLLIQADEFLSSNGSSSCWQRRGTSACSLSDNTGPVGGNIEEKELAGSVERCFWVPFTPAGLPSTLSEGGDGETRGVRHQPGVSQPNRAAINIRE
jgi:hypothetical protein